MASVLKPESTRRTKGKGELGLLSLHLPCLGTLQLIKTIQRITFCHLLGKTFISGLRPNFWFCVFLTLRVEVLTRGV